MKKLLLLACLLFPLTPNAQAAKTIVILGDSITEGYGVQKEKAFPALVEKKLQAAKLDWKVNNAGVSGSTSASAPSRTDWILKSKPDAILLALGANDGLRGLSTESMEKNLREAITKMKAAKVKVFLAGMQMPPNFGADYTKKYREVFPRIAKEEKIELLPFLLEDVGGVDKLNLADRIHPNEEGHKVIADHVFTFLKGKL
jgi:acyl-CoA thioesterase I